MKKHLILALTALITVVVAACNQNDVSPASATASTLANARIGSVTATSALTRVNGDSEVVITASQLPAAVLTYLSTNYPGYTLVLAEQGVNRKDGTTYYEVKFTTNGTTKELHFDMTGALQNPSHDGKKGHGGGGNSNEVVITADKLPAAAITYLNTNYAGYTIVQAEQGTKSDGTVYYEVQFTLNGKTKEIHFDANGALI